MSKPGRCLLYIGRHPRGISGPRGVGGPDRLRVCFFQADRTAARGLCLFGGDRQRGTLGSDWLEAVRRGSWTCAAAFRASSIWKWNHRKTRIEFANYKDQLRTCE